MKWHQGFTEGQRLVKLLFVLFCAGVQTGLRDVCYCHQNAYQVSGISSDMSCL